MIYLSKIYWNTFVIFSMTLHTVYIHVFCTYGFLAILSENLKELNSKELSEADADRLGDIDVPVSEENEEKAWAFLQTRTALLLRAYETSEEV